MLSLPEKNFQLIFFTYAFSTILIVCYKQSTFQSWNLSSSMLINALFSLKHRQADPFPPAAGPHIRPSQLQIPGYVLVTGAFS